MNRTSETLAAAPRSQQYDRPNLARLTLDGTVLPRIEMSLWFAERLRAALLSHVGDRACPELTGKDSAGQPRQGHGHAILLPQGDARGKVSHVLAHARDGFGPTALHALGALRVLYGVTSRPVYTTLAGLVRVESLERPPPQFRAATRWESLTPFVPPRAPKERRGQRIDDPEAQIRRLCQAILGAEPSAVHIFSNGESRARRFHAYRRERQRGGPRLGAAPGLGVRLEFAAPVRGPLVLGHGAHFGLGQFVALDD